MENKLLFGKNPLQNIVSLEVKNDQAEVFIQQPDGSVTSEIIPNRYWLVSHEKPHSSWRKLEGNLFYQYGKQFQTRNEFMRARNWLKNKDSFSIWNPTESLMVLKGLTYYKGLAPKDISILSFDLETTGIDHNKDSMILCISNTFRKNGQIIKKLFSYDEYEDQRELIGDWCNWVREIDPSIISGYNCNLFDLPYIQFIAHMVDIDLHIGRDGSNLFQEDYESKFRKDGSQDYHYRKFKCYGREIVDGLFLTVRYDIGRKFSSYKLKTVIKEAGLEKEGRTFYDASKIRHNYKIPEEWAKIKEYCKDDGDDNLAIFDLTIPAQFYAAQMIPKPFQMITESATGSQINSIMIRSYIQDAHSLPKASEAEAFEGAISIGNPGIYSNVFKVDVASLYPSIMIQYKVYDPDKDPKAYFLELVETLTAERLKNKKLAKDTKQQYYKDLEQSQKVIINSCYGFMGSKGLLFNSPKNAAFVTRTGREILQKAIDWALNKGFTLCNADTDSISFCQGDQSFISKETRLTLLAELNSLFPEKIRFEDDGYYIKIVALAAKNYILQDESGKVKIKGSSLKDPKKELALQEFIKEIIDLILNNNYNYIETYNKYAREILNLKDIKRWCSKKTVTSKILEGTRTNETKVKDAIEGSEYKEGDKVQLYFDVNENLKLVENYNNDHHISRLLKKLNKVTETFESIIPKETFPNYSLKKFEKTDWAELKERS